MSKSGFTLYVRGFSDDTDEEELTNIFSSFGTIIKCFIHKNRTYGMVEFEDLSSCSEAIKSLNDQPPLHLYVKMAKTQSTDKVSKTFNESREHVSMNESRGSRYSNINEERGSAQRNNIQPVDVDSVSYITEEIYIDENNCVVDVLKDPSTDELYVPIRYAPGIRCIEKRTPVVNRGLGNDLEDYDDNRSTHSSGSNRRVQYSQNSLTLQVTRTEIENGHRYERNRDSFENHNGASAPRRFSKFDENRKPYKSGHQSVDKNRPRLNKNFSSGGDSNSNDSRKFQRRDFNRPRAEEDWVDKSNEPQSSNAYKNVAKAEEPAVSRNNFSSGGDSNPNDSRKFQRRDFNRPRAEEDWVDKSNEPQSSNSYKNVAKAEEPAVPRNNFSSGGDSNPNDSRKFQRRDFNRPRAEEDWVDKSNEPQSSNSYKNVAKAEEPAVSRNNFSSGGDRNPNHPNKFQKREFNRPKTEEDWVDKSNDPKSSNSYKNVAKAEEPAVSRNNLHATLPNNTPSAALRRPANQIKSDIKSYETIELPKNVFTEVHVETVVSDTNGWVQISDKINDFIELMSEIMEHQLLAPNSIEPEVGKMCLASYEEAWYRAIVLSTTPKVKVRFIDYGNEAIVDEQILELSPKFQSVPGYAICINLANGAPCKLQDDMTLKVKPVKIENDVVEVHVENGIYDTGSPQGSTGAIPKTTPSKLKKLSTPQLFNSLEACQKSTMDKLAVDMTGILTPSIKVSDTEAVAFFLPEAMADYAVQLENLSNDIDEAVSSFNPKVGDLVAAEHEGYNRAYILEVNIGFKVAFIDYGIIKMVTEVKPLPTAYKTIPQFSCLFTCNSVDKIKIDSELLFTITKILNKTVHCTLQDNDEAHEITFVLWSPKNDKANSNKSVSSSSSSLETVRYVEEALQPPELKLKNNDDVKIYYCDDSDGFLYLRTKEGSIILKRIAENIDQSIKKAAKKSPIRPYVGQYVAAEFDGIWNRAQIISITENRADIRFIDFGNKQIKPLFSLKQLDEQMIKEPLTLIKVKLRNFVNKPLTERKLQYLESLGKKILKVSFQGSIENGVDLITKDGENIVDKLLTLDPKPKQDNFYTKVKIPGPNDPRPKIIKLEEIPLGKGNIKFLNDIDFSTNSICVCANNPEALNKVHFQLKYQMTKYAQIIAPEEPYIPITQELILVEHEGTWYRALCLNFEEDESISVFFIDYGFSSKVTPDQIRKLPVEFINEYDTLGNFAMIDGLPEKVEPEVIERLESLFLKNEIYPAEVLSKDDDDTYIIRFPHVINDLKAKNLL